MRVHLPRPFGVLGLLVAVALCVTVILVLALDVRRQVDALAISNSDSAEWSIAQTDVEMLAFLVELRAAQAGDTTLDQLRRRHDVLYGRVMLLQSSPLYTSLHPRPEFRDGMAQANAFLAWSSVLMDGPEAALVRALPDMTARATALRPVLRTVTLGGHRLMAADSDLRRETARRTLARTAAMTLVLVAALAGTILTLILLVRQTLRRAEEQAMTRARLQAIIATSFDAILVIDGRGRVLEYNGAAEALFGHPRRTAIGQDVARLLTWPDRGIPAPGTLSGAAQARHRIEGIRADGSRFPAECAIGLSHSEDAPVRVLFLHDISDRIAAEHALVEARDHALAGEKAKADMLAVMSHEMRTPLNGILGTLDLMEATRLAPAQRDYLRIIRTSGELLLDHVNDVLDIARLDAGKMSVARLGFDADALLRDLVDSQRPAAEAQGNRIELLADGPSPGVVTGDPLKLRQVLLNLVGNAVKFTRDGRISVSARRRPDGKVDFTVRDTGIGIPRHEIQRIFDEFVTIDSSYGRSAQGTGLGLSIARRMAQAMGGTITVDSTEGEGSLFRVTLPLPPAPATPPPAPAGPDPVAPPVPARHVLVVEDNPINRFVVRAMLENDGHRVTEAMNGTEGLRMARQNRYDLVLMDIGMPEMDGVSATRALRADPGAASRDTPVVALTAHALPADMRRFEAAGFAATLLKPLSIEALRALMARMTGARDDEALIDPSRLATLRDGIGAEVFATLLNRYVEETGEGIAALSAPDAVADPDLVHQLAGSAAIFGAAALHHRLAALETALRAGAAEARPLSEGLAPLWQETREGLERMREPGD